MGICQSKKINPIIPIIVDELDKKNISVNFSKTIEKVNSTHANMANGRRK